MTEREYAALNRAIIRAHEKGIRLVSQGYRKTDGERVYAVSSATNPRRWHLVSTYKGHLVCTCPAGQNGVAWCMHRGLIHEHLRLHAHSWTATRG